MSAGDTLSTLAMLSKFSLESSPGSSVVASTGRSSRSRTAFAYSARLRRCRTGAPGLGLAAAARSSASSSCEVTRSSVARSGRGAPLGGIMPVRSFRTTFSHACGSRPTCSTSSWSSTSPPAFIRSLWQVAQYRSSIARASAGVAARAAADSAPVPHADARRRSRECSDAHEHSVRDRAGSFVTAGERAHGRTRDEVSAAASGSTVWLAPCGSVPRAAPRARAISCSSRAIVFGLRSAPTAARKTPSAHRSAVRPSLSLTSRRAPRSHQPLDDLVRAPVRGAQERRQAHRVRRVHVRAELQTELDRIHERLRRLGIGLRHRPVHAGGRHERSGARRRRQVRDRRRASAAGAWWRCRPRARPCRNGVCPVKSTHDTSPSE